MLSLNQIVGKNKRIKQQFYVTSFHIDDALCSINVQACVRWSWLLMQTYYVLCVMYVKSAYLFVLQTQSNTSCYCCEKAPLLHIFYAFNTMLLMLFISRMNAIYEWNLE